MNRTVHTNIHTSRPLINHFETQTFGQLSLNPALLTFHISYQPTKVAKTVIKALIGKLPTGNDEPIDIDIDLGAGLYNAKDELIDTVWYGKVRNDNESVILNADDFGDNLHRPSILSESLSIAINSLPDDVQKIVIFVACSQKIALKEAMFGKIVFECDHEQLHELLFASLEDNAKAVAGWQLTNVGGDWQIKALFEPHKALRMDKIAKSFTGLTVTDD